MNLGDVCVNEKIHAHLYVCIYIIYVYMHESTIIDSLTFLGHGTHQLGEGTYLFVDSVGDEFCTCDAVLRVISRDMPETAMNRLCVALMLRNIGAKV